MAEIGKLTEKILEDAEKEKDAILKSAVQEGEKIIARKISEGIEEKKAIIEKAKLEGKSIYDRILSSNLLKIRNEKLEAKQEIIDKVFKKALEELQKLNVNSYTEFIINKALDLDLKGDEKIIFGRKDEFINKTIVVNEINNRLKDTGKAGKISLSEEKRNFKGGFIIEKNSVEINNTFEALVALMREELELQVVEILFS